MVIHLRMLKKQLRNRAVVVVQLVEWSFLISKICSLNPVISNVMH